MEKRKRKVPHTFVLLMSITLIVSLLSYVVPSGEYDMVEVENRLVVDADSFHYVENQHVSILQFLTSLTRGMQESSGIVFFIFIVGGSFNVINATGAMEVGVNNLAKKLQNNKKLLIPVIIFVFSILGGTVGLSEETIIFVPIGIALARSLGYDAIVGMAIVFSGAAVGFVSGFMNPFTVGVAQEIAELPMFSGIWLRLIIWAVYIVTTIIYIQKYANKVEEDPSYSYVADLEEAEKHKQLDLSQIKEVRTVHKLVIGIFALGILLLVYGVFVLEWYIDEISALFLGMALLSAMVCRISPSDIALTFIEGAKDITMGALIVGIARSILVVLNDGAILYTIVNFIARIIRKMPKQITAVVMFLLQSALNFFIPSGSGQASTTMPIMTPISDIVGISRQTAVLAFQLGDGISNSIIPTGGSLLAALSVANIDYEKWVKFIWKLMVIWTILGCIFVSIASIINYGPF